MLLLLFAASGIGPRAAAAEEPPSNDPFVDFQWNLQQIDAFDAWQHATGKGAVVAVVDSGIDLTHPDLDDNITREVCTGEDQERVCETVTQDNKDFVDGEEPEDEVGHGTHVAGIIAAEANNEEGIAGIAPNAWLMVVRVLDEQNGGTDADIISGIRWAADHGADVINVSIGYPLPVYGRASELLVPDYLQAIQYAWDQGAVVVLAAGNNYQPLCDSTTGSALCVGATGPMGEKTHYSNFDGTMQENYLVAPGGETIVLKCEWTILSTWARVHPENDSCNQAGDGYTTASGTSMAAPAVSGVAALLVELGLTNAQIVQRILATAQDLGTPGKDPVFGAGQVNALRAVTNQTS